MSLLRRIKHGVQRRMLSPTTRAVQRDRLTYLHWQRLRRIEGAMQETRNVPGDMAEFGIALGGSGIILAKQASAERRFHGFDVFGMIPPPASEKDEEKSRARYEVIRSGQSAGIGGDEYYGYKPDLFEEVKASFARHDVPVDGRTILLHKGLFEETWPTAGIRALALVHIDCDFYDAVHYSLSACADRMSPGSIIIADDYNDHGGCRAAVSEFLAQHDDFTFEAGPNPFLRKRA